MRSLTLLTLLLALCLTLPAQTSYSVDPVTGDDANPGTLAQPWRTIQHSMDNATPGSVVFIAPGIYNETLNMNVSGSPGNFIEFFGNGTIIDGGGGPATLLYIEDKHNIRLKGLRFRNAVGLDATGLMVTGSSDSIEVLFCQFSGIHFSADSTDTATASTNAQPLAVYGTHFSDPIQGVLIKHCEVRHCRTGYSEGMVMNGNVDGFEISHCTVEDLTNIGIDAIGHEGTCPNPTLDQARNGRIWGNTVSGCVSPYAWAAGIYIDGALSVVVENNLITGCQYGIEVGCENVGKTAADITVRNNYIHDNLITGIALGGFDFPAGSGRVVASRITCNTLQHNNKEALPFPAGEMILHGLENVQVRNNIIQCDLNDLLSVEDSVLGLEMDYNLYHGESPLTAGIHWLGDFLPYDLFSSLTGQDTNSLFADPGFISLGHIGTSSPAVNRGDPAYVKGTLEADLDMEVRIAGGRVDIGADETGSTVGTVDEPAPALLLYPQPADGEVRMKGLPAHAACISVHDLNGRLVCRQSPAASMDVSSWPVGLYLLRVLDAQGQVLASGRLSVMR